MSSEIAQLEETLGKARSADARIAALTALAEHLLDTDLTRAEELASSAWRESVDALRALSSEQSTPVLRWCLAESFRIRALCASRRGTHQKALQLFANAEEEYEGLNKKPELAVLQRCIGEELERSGDELAALERYRRSLKLFRDCGTKAEINAAILKLAKKHFESADYGVAIGLYRENLILHREDDNKLGEADALLNIGNVHWGLGEFDAALEAYGTSRELLEQLDEKKSLASAYNNLGAVYLYKGEYALVLEYFLKALSLRRECGDEENIAGSLLNVGNVYFHLGHFSPALEYYLQSLEYNEGIGDKRVAGDVLMNLGAVYENTDDSEQALEHYLQSLEIRTDIGDKASIGATLINIAMLYLNRGDVERSLDYAGMCLNNCRKIGDRRVESYALQGMGEAYLKVEDYDRAFELFQEALGIRRDLEYKTGIAETLRTLGAVLLSRQQPAEALPRLEEALAIAREINEKEQIQTTLFAIAEVMEQSGDVNRALEYYKESRRVREDALTEDNAEKIANLKVLHQVEQSRKEKEIYRLKYVELEAANTEISRQQEILEEQAVKIELKNTELQERNTQLEQLIQEKNEFLGITSHDLKNPVSAVSLIAEFLVDDADELSAEELRDYGRDILNSTESMTAIIRNLLDINRLESGKITFRMTAINLRLIAYNMVVKYRRRADKKRITLLYESESSDCIAWADEDVMEQIADNLISNAVKYSPFDKRVWVKVAASEEAVRMEVRDEGPGIASEDIPRLFKKYTRLRARPTGGEHSTGLGLSIVKKLVEEMQGKVWCESVQGQGATFIVEMQSHPGPTANQAGEKAVGYEQTESIL